MKGWQKGLAMKILDSTMAVNNSYKSRTVWLVIEPMVRMGKTIKQAHCEGLSAPTYIAMQFIVRQVNLSKGV